ncbi:unnamed protein product, partial [Urochloa humidicola]
ACPRRRQRGARPRQRPVRRRRRGRWRARRRQRGRWRARRRRRRPRRKAEAATEAAKEGARALHGAGSPQLASVALGSGRRQPRPGSRRGGFGRMRSEPRRIERRPVLSCTRRRQPRQRRLGRCAAASRKAEAQSNNVLPPPERMTRRCSHCSNNGHNNGLKWAGFSKQNVHVSGALSLPNDELVSLLQNLQTWILPARYDRRLASAGK